MKTRVSQANVITRVGALAGRYGIDLAPLQGALGALGPDLARVKLVTVSAAFDQIAVTTRVARERLDELVEREQARRIGKVAPDARALELELETGPRGVARTVRARGSRNVTADCEQLASLGVGTLALDSLRDCAAHLGVPTAIADRVQGSAPEWWLEFEQHNRSDAERATARMQLLTVARKLAATAQQCGLVDGLHDALAKDGDSYPSLRIDPDQTSLQLAVRWQRVTWETVVRMGLNFHPTSDAAAKLAELAAAFAAEHATFVDLVLGPAEPPQMRVAVAFSP